MSRATPKLSLGVALASTRPTRHGDQQRLHQSFQRVQSNLKKLRFDRSPFVPSNMDQYIEHLLGIKAILEQEKAEAMEEPAEKSDEIAALMNYLHPGPSSIEHVIDTDCFRDRVIGLANVTIWAPTWQPTVHHPMALWPPEQEFREEGDERHTSQFGRFLPVPRGPGGNNANWKQKPFLKQFDMDRVRPVPKKCFGIQLPYDIEVWEPTINEDGMYVDDKNESGRESFGDTSGRRASKGVIICDPTSLEVLSSKWGHSRLEIKSLTKEASTLTSYRREYKVPIAQDSYNGGYMGTPSPLHALPDQSEFLVNGKAYHGETKSANLLTQKCSTSEEPDKPIAVILAEELLGSRKSSNPHSGPYATYGCVEDGTLISNMNQQVQFEEQTQQVGGMISENGNRLDTNGGRVMYNANPWRKVGYGRNSFGMSDTIHEESPEELMETVFGTGRGNAWGRTPSRASIDSELAQRAFDPSLILRSESVSPMTAPVPRYGNRSYYEGPRSNTLERLQQDFGQVGLRFRRR